MLNTEIPLILRGKHVSLEPLSLTHHDDLVTAVKDGELWKLWYTLVPSPIQMKDAIQAHLEKQKQGTMLPFAVIDNYNKKTVGITTYLNLDKDNKRVEIGYTWYQQSSQGSTINTECKLLLLSHAFEVMRCIAVEFRTHFFNQKSRKAIERLGAKFDGILRNHMIMPNGTLRDTCIYSIIASEWPTVKANLEHRFLKMTPVNIQQRDVYL